jgi:hypothetical protein
MASHLGTIKEKATDLEEYFNGKFQCTAVLASTNSGMALLFYKVLTQHINLLYNNNNTTGSQCNQILITFCEIGYTNP